MVSAIIIGGGIVGVSIAYHVADFFDDVYVIEKEPRLGEHASSRSSEVIHAGIYYKPGSNKAKLCVKGNRILRTEFLPRYHVNHNIVGKLIVARTENEISQLEKLAQKAKENDVPDTRIIDTKEVRKFEPNVKSAGALYVPTSGIFDTSEYLNTLEKLAADKGVIFVKNAEVVGIDPMNPGYNVHYSIGENQQDPFQTDFVFNAAGLHADKIARMLGFNEHTIRAVRGEIASFNQTRPEIQFAMNIYPVPHTYNLPGGGSTHTTGVHITPTLNEDGTLNQRNIITPLYSNPRFNVDGTQDVEDYNPEHPPEDFHARVVDFAPDLKVSDIKPPVGGNSAKLLESKDFVFQGDGQYFATIGIDSPGLTSSIPIGIEARKWLVESHGFK
ncbi:MAG: FAD-dependent oxidoreductase [Candidatus Woesearchaeota archaeon]